MVGSLPIWIVYLWTSRYDCLQNEEVVMGFRKAVVTATVKLVIELAEKVTIEEVMEEMSYDFISLTAGASMIDMEILDYKVKE